MTSFFLALAAAIPGLGALVPPPHTASRSQAARRLSPQRSADPASLPQGRHLVWQLVASGNACALSRRLAGRRFAAEDCAPLNNGACRVMDCNCIYQAVTNERRKSRRLHVSRREQFRLGTAGTDRRSVQDRRHARANWADRSYA